MTERHGVQPLPRRGNLWTIAMIVILVLALASRLYMLGDRAVSHDETTHAKYSWNLYTGQGFSHDPLMHGPLLFEATALMYALFGVSDFTARLYAAFAGVALVMSPWLLRRWLGRLGAVLASVMLLISPSIAYYSRYTRHDVPILLFSTLLLWSIGRYLEDGKSRWLRWMGAFFALMYATKENAYIYTAIFAVLLVLPLVWQVLRARWTRRNLIPVAIALVLLIVLAGAVTVLALFQAEVAPEGEGNHALPETIVPVWGRAATGIAVIGLLALVVLVTYAVGVEQMRRFRLFDVLIVLGSFTLPLGSALLMQFVAGVGMASFYPAMMSMSFAEVAPSAAIGAGLTLALALAAGALMGLWWDARRWPLIALVHYAIFIVLYSTVFTYGWGVITGFVGGLAYWIAQQHVERGTQPWYYYGVVGPLYEYAAILISVTGVGALVIAAARRGLRRLGQPRAEAAAEAPDPVQPASVLDGPAASAAIARFLPFFLFAWAILSWIAYAVAGEKMPWLFVHIALPHILLAAWTLNWAFGHLAWRDLVAARAWLIPVSLVCLLLAWGAFQASSGTIRQVLQQSGAGEGLADIIARLEPLGRIVGGLLGIALFSALLYTGITSVGFRRALTLGAVTLVALLGGLTLRTMINANYLDDELAVEYIVYAHSTPDVKKVLAEVESLSWRLTGTPDQIQVAYGKEVAWPFYWYMYSRFPNNYYFETPDPEQLLASPVVIAAYSEWGAVEEILGSEYEAFDYKHIWWPVEDYKDLTWERIRNALTSPEWRKALWDIVWKRDYRRYARLRDPENPFTFKTWPHRVEFRFYVRRDLAGQIWAYELDETGGIAASAGNGGSAIGLDPYTDAVALDAATVLATLPETGLRGLAAAPDGSFYAADAGGHQILHLSAQGEVLTRWGGYGTGPGQFNSPGDVAVDEEGNVYVADTWNHRVQKFTADGTHVLTWGRFAQARTGDVTGHGALYGPRGVAVGPEGRIYVADTGNDRIQVFDRDGQFVAEFGAGSMGWEGLDEPSDVAVDVTGDIYVADAWRQRVAVFNQDGYYLMREWQVPVWAYLRSDARPQLAVDADNVYVTDPAYGRALVFSVRGDLISVLHDTSRPGQPGGIATVPGQAIIADEIGAQLLAYRLAYELSPEP